MGRNRIKSNFYATSIRKYEPISDEEYEELSDWSKEFIGNSRYWFVEHELPDGRLYSGHSTQHPTKLTKDDLPPDYTLMNAMKGYIRTAGVKGLVYRRSPFHNHTFRDDWLYISYTHPLDEYVVGFEDGSTFSESDEHIYGNDIVDFIAAVNKWSPAYDTSRIMGEMVEQYNAYCDEMNEMQFIHCDKIEKFEDLL